MRRQLTDLRNKAEGLAYSTEKTLEEFADEVGDDDRKALEAAVAKTREAAEAGDVAVLETAVEELSQASFAMTEKLYAALGGS